MNTGRRDSDFFRTARRRSSIALDSLTHSLWRIDSRDTFLARRDSDLSLGGRQGSQGPMEIDRRDSFSLGISPTPNFLPILRRESAVSDFWDDEHAMEEDITPGPRVGSPKRQMNSPPSSPKKKGRQVKQSADDDEYSSIKLGDQRRKMIKSAISEKYHNDPAIRERIKQIGFIKSATVSELMKMAEVCGLLDWALQLARSREVEKQITRH